jgi:hypothetical protein
MLSLRGDFVAVGRLSDVDGKILVGPSRDSKNETVRIRGATEASRWQRLEE